MQQQPIRPQDQRPRVSSAGRSFLLRWRFQRFCTTCGCLFQVAFFALKWVAILLVLVIIWLSVWGVPRPWLDRTLAELRQHGFILKVGQARLDIFHGLAFEDVALYESATARSPLLAAEKISVFINPRDWRRGEHGIRSISILNGVTTLELGYAHLPGVCVSNIQTRLWVAGNDLRVSEWTCDALGAHWSGHGVVREAFGGPAISHARLNLAAALALLRRTEPDWLKPALDFRQAATWFAAPTLNFDFVVVRGTPAANRIHAQLQGGAMDYASVHFSQWQAELASTGTLVHAAATLQQGGQQLAVRGWIDGVPPYTATAGIVCDLPAKQVLALLPDSWAAAYADGGFFVNGPAALNLTLGPAPAGSLLEHIEGACRLRNLDAGHVAVPRLKLQFIRHGDEVTFVHVAADVGAGTQRGQLDGNFALHLKTRTYAGQAHTTFDPNVLGPAVNAGTSNLLALMHFRGQPPVCDVTVTGLLDDASALLVTGRVVATNFTFREEPVMLAESTFSVLHGVLDLPDAHAVREDGQAQGHVTYNMDDALLELNVSGVAPLHPVAHMIAPGFERIMRQFEFQGPVQLLVNGRISVGSTLRGTDLRVSAEGEHMGWQRLLADHASFDLIATGSHFTFTNIHGVFCGGPFQGVADFSDVEAPTNCRYTASVVLTNANFARLCEMLHPASGGGTAASGTMTGELTGQAQLSGWLDPWKSMEGSGSVYVHNGSIFQFRLFGGLSKVLDKIYPGLGYLSQTELHMPFTVGGGKLRSDDISIKGTVISLSSRGEYRFSNELDFQAQVQLLRNGIFADVVRWVTTPLTKLLEFKLIGTLEEPRWRPVNLPKELFLQFD